MISFNMNIAIDLTPIPPQKTGVGIYAVNLIRALGNFDNKNQYWIFVKNSHSQDFDPKRENFHIVIYSNILQNKFLRLAWEQVVLPIQLWRKKIELLHSIHYTTPLFAPCKRVITFHDMTFFLFPEKHVFIKKIFFRVIIPFSAKKANRLIAVSESTKKDIETILGIDGGKIDVVYETIDKIFRPIEKSFAISQIKEKYKIKDKFILYVGVLEPRKNISTLIKAYANLIFGNKINHQLIIVGKKGWGCQEIFKIVQNLNLSKKVIFTGYLSEKELVFLYNGADLFVYPSLYEGFGIPPLEALACGTPVLSSNISSIPEVVGEEGILVNPHNIEEISESMYRVLTDEKLRNVLKEKGIRRAKEFSEEKLAKKTIEVYKKVTRYTTS